MTLVPGCEYIHEDWGRVLYIAPHPCDGGTQIVERGDPDDTGDEDLRFDICERSDLQWAVGSTWPFLGFNCGARWLDYQKRHDAGEFWVEGHPNKGKPVAEWLCPADLQEISPGVWAKRETQFKEPT